MSDDAQQCPTPPQEIGMPSEEFRDELAALLNRHSLESGSDTPDHILADYLVSCIMQYDATVRARDAWWGRPSMRGYARWLQT